jgi:hypothetical protein
MNLWNGNVFPNIEFDFTHSSDGYNTVFRNYVKLAEAAWLTTRFASHSSDYVSLQYVLWYLMNPGSESTSFGDVQHWLDLTAANYGSIDSNQFAIITNVGPVTLTGQVQEFIIRTPERLVPWHFSSAGYAHVVFFHADDLRKPNRLPRVVFSINHALEQCVVDGRSFPLQDPV